MSDDSSDPTAASGAGDPTPTQPIARVTKKPSSATATTGGEQRSPSAASRALNGAQSASASESAKQTPAEPAKKTSEPQKPEPSKPETAKQTPASTTARKAAGTPAAKKPVTGSKPSTDADHRTLTAADYARTTRSSPAATAVIPAVKDSPRPKPAVAAAAAKAPAPSSGRRASLRLTRVEPWSVTKIAFAISVALMIVGVVAITIFWTVLEVVGVWDQINSSVTSVLSDDGTGFDITDYFGFTRLIGLTLVVSAINVVLFTALATIGAYLYNLAAQLLGGAEVTFAEEN